MAASAIAISSDSSDESAGSPPSRVILFGDIPTVIPSTFVVAPETSTIAPVISSAPVVETTLVASPTGLCGLVLYSGSDSDSPDEMSSREHISSLPPISPFLCTDSSEAPDSSDGPPLQDPYVATIARWRNRVTTRLSSLSKFPIAPITTPPRIHRWSAILIRPGEAIPFGRPYRTHLNGPLHSSGLDVSDQAHSGSLTRVVSPRLCYHPRRAPRRSEAFRRWCAAPLSTLYPPTTSESSSGDSSERPLHSSLHSAGPSRKRCRSLVDSAPSSTPVMGSLAPTRADLLPPRKRFGDSYSSEASIEEDVEVSPIKTEVDMELGIGDGDDVRDHVKFDPRDVRDDTEEYEADTSAGDTVESGTRDDIVRSFEDMPIDLDDAVRDFYHRMSEVPIDRIVEIKTAQSRLEADQLVASRDRARMAERIYSLRLENLKVHAMLDIERDHVNSLRLHIDDDSGNGNGGNGNGGNGNGRNENPNENVRGARPVARECTYQDFMKCQPLNFKGTEGVVGLIRWFEKMETVFHISNCPEKSQVKYATCTLLDSALTWWNSHKRTIRTEAAFAMSWRELMKQMTEVYCPRNEIQKMETKLWNLTVKNNDLTAYTQRLQELTMMCTKMAP
ncbi:putative reverse transcriptase domain-containing protein [Tanacetum coccineum]